MARTRMRRGAENGLGALLEMLTREWGRTAARRLPPEFTAHMRAAVRELCLAVAALGASALRAAEARTAEARRRVERIPVGPRPATRRRAARRRS